MKKRNIIFNLLLLGILFFGLRISANAQQTSVPSGYTGIYDIADLSGIRNNPSGKYILMSDIDMTKDTAKGGDWDSGMGWTPIETFSGVLDGNGHQIIGMNIYTEGSDGQSYIGLIGKLKEGTVENLGMKNVTINVAGDYTGSIVGYISGGEIKNCYSSGKIRASKYSRSSNYAGGIVGYLDWGTVKDCFNMTDISSDNSAEYAYAGGIIGYRYYHSYAQNIENNYSRGMITGARYMYGITSESVDGSCKNCFYLKGSVQQSENIDGVRTLTDAQMKRSQVFTNFDFKNTWDIDPYSNYPYPQLRSNPYIRVTKLQILAPPDKTVYQQGESLNLHGATVRITYDDGNVVEEIISNDMLSPYDMKKIGTQKITVNRGGKSVSFNIEVKGIMPTSITLNKTYIDLYKGKTQQLTAGILPANASYKTATWTSSDTSVATVSSTGLVTAKNAGKATITAKTTNGLTAKCTVNVMVPAVQLSVEQSQFTLKKGDSKKINVTLSPLNSTDKVSWSSDNSAVAKVIDGTVIGTGAGKTIIRVKTGSGLSKTCTVTVKQDINEFTVSGITNKTYTGGKIVQSIKVYSGKKVLKEGTDYSVAYKNNVAVGKAEVKITGKGYYVGSQNFTFAINKRNIANTRIFIDSDESTMKYDGRAKKPGFEILEGSKELQPGRDYTYIYKSNVAPGRGIIAITGKGNYAGSKQATFTIPMPKSSISKIAALKKKKVKIIYSGVKGAYNYEVQYSMKSNFAGAKTKTVKATALKVSKLKANKKYYFRVRVCAKVNGKTYYSGWSRAKSVKVRK